MPIYEYLCQECDRTYDVLHMGKEIQDDILCPSCGSRSYKKLLSVPSGISMKTSSANVAPCGMEGGCCGGGECGMG
jgi:putative FmdB family regulatory protein